jgi:hypothetical protein
MIYKFRDLIVENTPKMNWGIIFVKCNKYNLIEKNWDNLFDYENSFDGDWGIYSYDTLIEFMSSEPDLFLSMRHIFENTRSEEVWDNLYKRMKK